MRKWEIRLQPIRQLENGRLWKPLIGQEGLLANRGNDISHPAGREHDFHQDPGLWPRKELHSANQNSAGQDTIPQQGVPR